MKKTKEEIENCLTSNLQNMIYELEVGNIDENLIYDFFSEILLDANVDSHIVVNVLERSNFGTSGKEAARYIKVNEGW